MIWFVSLQNCELNVICLIIIQSNFPSNLHMFVDINQVAKNCLQNKYVDLRLIMTKSHFEFLFFCLYLQVNIHQIHTFLWISISCWKICHQLNLLNFVKLLNDKYKFSDLSFFSKRYFCANTINFSKVSKIWSNMASKRGGNQNNSIQIFINFDRKRCTVWRQKKRPKVNECSSVANYRTAMIFFLQNSQHS